MAGASNRAAFFAKYLSEDDRADIVGISDPYVRKADWIAQEHSLKECRSFDTVDKMLDSVDCEAVIVASSDANHAAGAVPALEKGKYVFCEKPMETTMEKVRAIIKADEKAGGKTFVGFNMRYAPLYETVKAQIEKGVVGEILTIQADEFYDGGRTYFRRWNRLRSEGGGLWITKASHDFDILYWLAGGAMPLEVSAMAEKTYYVPKADAAAQCRNCDLEKTCPDRAPREPRPLAQITEESGGEPWDLCLYNSKSDTFDHSVACIRFENDILVSHTCSVVSGFSNRRIRVSGTRGTLDGSLHDNTVILLKRDPNERVEIPLNRDISGEHGGADNVLIDTFLAFIRGEATPKSRPREAAVATSIGLAARKSSDEHRMVQVERP